MLNKQTMKQNVDRRKGEMWVLPWARAKLAQAPAEAGPDSRPRVQDTRHPACTAVPRLRATIYPETTWVWAAPSDGGQNHREQWLWRRQGECTAGAGRGGLDQPGTQWCLISVSTQDRAGGHWGQNGKLEPRWGHPQDPRPTSVQAGAPGVLGRDPQTSGHPEEGKAQGR